MARELAAPPGAETDEKAVELIRAWAAHGGLQCSLNVGAWTGEQAAIAWGILLSDVARHVTDALYKSKKMDKKSTLERMRKAFNDEIDKPTAEAKGDFV